MVSCIGIFYFIKHYKIGKQNDVAFLLEELYSTNIRNGGIDSFILWCGALTLHRVFKYIVSIRF